MTPREQDAHADLCRSLVTALAERDAARAEVARVRGAVEEALSGGTDNHVSGHWVVQAAAIRAALVQLPAAVGADVLGVGAGGFVHHEAVTPRAGNVGTRQSAPLVVENDRHDSTLGDRA